MIAERARQLRSDLSNPMRTSGGMLVLVTEDQIHITMPFSVYSMVHSLFAAALGCYDDDATLVGKLDELGQSVHAKVCNRAHQCTIELPGLDDPIEISEEESDTVLGFIAYVLSGDEGDLEEIQDEAVPHIDPETGSRNFQAGGEG